MLQANNIRRAVDDLLLLKDVSLTVRAAERLAIVGPTGSGKTLLLRALALLDPIDCGEIRWQGRAVRGNSVPEFRSRVMYLHQRPALVEGTVEDNLRIPFTLRSQQGRQYSRDAIQTHLKQVDRHVSFLDRSTRDLSGGEAQIVALLRAIQLEPTVLLLDEPTAALDDETTHLIEQLVRGWCDDRDAERALIWVSHNRQQVTRIASRVVTMTGGTLADGTVTDKLDDTPEPPR
jgi:putative ABC transport system ATP-binding protein